LPGKPVNPNEASADLDRIDDLAKITPLAGPYLSRYRGLILPGRDSQADTRTNRAGRRWAWSPGRRGLTTRSASTGRLHVIAYRATLDVPRELVWFAARLLLAERRRRGTPRGSRALSCFWQAVLGLRWFRDRTSPDALARDHGISRATAYRYLEEFITVLADLAPDLREALERAQDDGLSHVILDGKVIPAGRGREKPSAPRARSSTCGTPARLNAGKLAGFAGP
jgi:hypothetical protein